MKVLYSVLLIFSAAAAISAQSVPAGFDLSNFGVRIEPDKRVMVVLAALEAARTTNEAGESVPVLKTPLSAQGQKFRELLTSDLAALNEDLRQKISSFVIQHKKRNPGKSDAELVSTFVSMAYALTPVPDLADPVVTSDLPGSLLDVLDFAPLVRDFYRRSSFSGNLPEYYKSYQAGSDGKLRTSAAEMVNELLGYLHTKPQTFVIERVTTQTQKTKRTTLKNVETRERERHFVIVPELLAPTNTVNFVNVKDDYYAIVSPDTDLVVSEVRRAFLQYVIDPIVLKNNKEISSIRDSVKKIIDDQKAAGRVVSPDVFLTVSRSLVAAVDARQTEYIRSRLATDDARRRIDQARTDDEKRKISSDLAAFRTSLADEAALRLSEDFEKGSVLDFYFYDQLAGIEDSGFDIAASMREMLLSFDPAKETGRYDRYSDARKRALAAREARRSGPEDRTASVENPVTIRLFEIQKTVELKDYTKAEADLRELLSKNPDEARIYYNLGRVASLSAVDKDNADEQAVKLQEAKVAYENVIRLARKQNVDPALQSLTYVALAKIYEFYDNRSYAMSIYDAAIKIGDVTGGAFREAIAAKQRLMKDQ